MYYVLGIFYYTPDRIISNPVALIPSIHFHDGITLVAFPQQLSGAAVDDVAAGERRQSPDRKLAGLSCDIDEAFKFLDGIQGDETVRDARRAQV